MGIEWNMEGSRQKCPECGRKVTRGKLITEIGLEICYDCYERLGGKDFEDALKEIEKIK